MSNVIKLNSVISRNEDIDVSELDGEKVMMNIELGKYFIMNSVGSEIWDIIDRPRELKEIIEYLMEIYEVDKEICIKSVKSYLNSLMEAKLIEIA